MKEYRGFKVFKPREGGNPYRSKWYAVRGKTELKVHTRALLMQYIDDEVDELCKNCRFGFRRCWFPHRAQDNDSWEYVCRRNPPQGSPDTVSVGKSPDGRWPAVSPFDWCGEWVKNE